jgi:hypothetical protein
MEDRDRYHDNTPDRNNAHRHPKHVATTLPRISYSNQKKAPAYEESHPSEVVAKRAEVPPPSSSSPQKRPATDMNDPPCTKSPRTYSHHQNNGTTNQENNNAVAVKTFKSPTTLSFERMLGAGKILVFVWMKP